MAFKRVIIFLAIILAGCSSQGDIQSTPASIPTEEPTPTSFPSPTSTTVSVPTPSPTTDVFSKPFTGMESPGPWLVLHTSEGTYILNQYGTEIGHISATEESYNRWSTAAPSGGLIATYSEPAGLLIGNLEIRRLQDNAVLFKQYLGTGAPAFGELDDDNRLRDDIYLAVGNMAWSNNGRYLGYTAAIEGPSSDLYTYDLESGIITQVSNTPKQAVDFYWSPDDEFLFHADVEYLHAFKSGSGYSGWQFYSSKPNGEDTKLILGSDLGDERGWEKVIGWHSDDEAVMVSDIWWCAEFDLRRVNIRTGREHNLLSDKFHRTEYNPNDKVSLVIIAFLGELHADCIPTMSTGIYLVPSTNHEIIKVTDDLQFFNLSHLYATFDPVSNKFYNIDVTNHYSSINSEGLIGYEYYESEPVFSPNGEWLAVLGDQEISVQNLVTGESQTVRTSNSVDSLIWNNVSDTFFFVQKNWNTGRIALVKASAPTFDPEIVIEGFSSYLNYPPLIWVNP